MYVCMYVWTEIQSFYEFAITMNFNFKGCLNRERVTNVLMVKTGPVNRYYFDENESFRLFRNFTNYFK